MIGLKRGTVTLCAYDPLWASVGQDYCARIKAALGKYAIEVAHVGSTAVPGLCAKPIIDVAVGVQSFDTQIIARMEKAGFLHRTSHDDDHNMLFVDGQGEVRFAHIHVVVYNGMEWRNYVNFVSFLRAFDHVSQAYAALKQALASKYPNDREAYTASKAQFISYTLRKAMVWSYLGKQIDAVVDRPVGYLHVKGSKRLHYPINYGYVPGVLGGDGEELDVYYLGVSEPLERFSGRVIAIAHRADDVEDKLVACPVHLDFNARDICNQILFQEKYYDTTIQTHDGQLLHISNGEEHGN